MKYYESMLEESLLLQQRIAYSGTNAQYIGYADPGVPDDKPLWLIYQLEYDSNSNVVAKRFASGTKAFDKIWDNRGDYSYA